MPHQEHHNPHINDLRIDKPINITYQNTPLITIVTVVFNSVEGIEKTIQSIIKQDYKNIEYIIIDGGSTDGTIDIIKKYEYAIDYWISEKDHGIYDAMNKGINLAKGKWINFMNAEDTFASPNVLSNIFQKHTFDDKTLIYGDSIDNYGDFEKYFKASNCQKKLWQGMQFSHQSTFSPTSYHKKFLFDTNYTIASDFHFIYNAYINGITFKYIPIPIAKIYIGGVSYTNRIHVIDEYQKISSHETTFIQKLYFIRQKAMMHTKNTIKKLLGSNLTDAIIKHK